MKPKFKSAFMDVARRFAELSTARKLHVGAIVVKDGRIVSIGYNGMPSGWDNECETSVLWDKGVQLPSPILKTKPEVLHAESNAIAKLARSPESGEGATAFITHAPCLDCAKLLYQAGICEVNYCHSYRLTDGIDFLKQCNIKVYQVSL